MRGQHLHRRSTRTFHLRNEIDLEQDASQERRARWSCALQRPRKSGHAGSSILQYYIVTEAFGTKNMQDTPEDPKPSGKQPLARRQTLQVAGGGGLHGDHESPAPAPSWRVRGPA